MYDYCEEVEKTKRMTFVDYYNTLDLKLGASDDDIRIAHRNLVRVVHPDVQETGNEAKFREVQEAYEVLSDPEKRKLYDSHYTNIEPLISLLFELRKAHQKACEETIEVLTRLNKE